MRLQRSVFVEVGDGGYSREGEWWSHIDVLCLEFGAKSLSMVDARAKLMLGRGKAAKHR